MRSSKSPAVLRATPAAASPQPKATRRNFIAPLIDVIGFTVGSSFLAPQAVLQEFVTHLTRSNVLIGLTTSVIWSSTSATQVLVSNHVERLAIKKRYVMVIATFERLAVLLLAILTPILAATRPTAMLVVLLALMAAHYAMMGCSIPAYSAMFTKIVPARQRGILYGLGGTIANALRAGAGLFIPFL
ncbi:hypothetical protein FJZ36_18480, partial [Candidatus Poribacteria bacterium]|nr:hypothetical protein [Candidatus Poribacteria bacterium]